MKKYILLFVFLFLAGKTFSQLSIPNFKSNITGEADAPFLKYIKNYDLVLAYRIYSNWSWETEYHILVFQGKHWKKLIYKKPNYNDPALLQIQPITEKPADDFLCDLLYNKLIGNNLFTIEDDGKIPPCNESTTIVNGEKITNQYSMSDGPEYSIWMITPEKSRHLYYYAPEYFDAHCAPNETNRAFAISIISILKREW